MASRTWYSVCRLGLEQTAIAHGILFPEIKSRLIALFLASGHTGGVPAAAEHFAQIRQILPHALPRCHQLQLG